MKPKLLDLCCAQGGASAGYAQAGFDVTGVDIKRQRRYPFTFHQADAVEFVKEHGHEYQVIAASPPCQAWSHCQRIRDNEHPDLIATVREVLVASGKPFIIENVEDARPVMVDPILICGAAFGLNTYRHRLFESNVDLVAPEHPVHTRSVVKMGRALEPGDQYHAVGNFIGVDYVREDMQVPWMSRNGIREAVPPSYTEFLGRQLMEALG